MRHAHQLPMVIALGGALLFVGCKKQKSPEQALEEGFQTQATQPGAIHAPQPGADHSNAQPVQQVVEQAAADIKAQNHATAARRLDAVATTPGISVEQLTAIQRARVAMEQELMQRARSGDQQALKALQELANRPKNAPGRR